MNDYKLTRRDRNIAYERLYFHGWYSCAINIWHKTTAQPISCFSDLENYIHIHVYPNDYADKIINEIKEKIFHVL